VLGFRMLVSCFSASRQNVYIRGFNSIPFRDGICFIYRKESTVLSAVGLITDAVLQPLHELMLAGLRPTHCGFN
jgi:hypothetical protein